HSPGWDMDIAAIALGASMVEKTITLDRTTRSVEHVMSLEPADMRRFVQAVRELEVALGSPRRDMTPEEIKRRQNVRRSIYLKVPAKAGTRLADAKVDFRRPGFGIGPDRYDELAERKLKTDLPAGHLLSMADLA